MKVRFAPSPTGFIHIGNIRTALINWLFAKRHGGEFVLRMDDTDLARSEKRFETAIIEDLAWLHMPHDAFFRQSERMEAYTQALERLKAIGRLYPCYETAEELELKRRTQLAQGRPPLYDRGALRLSEAERARLEAEGRRPHWRFLLEATPIEWADLVRGPVHFEGTALSDPILLREDGSPVYTLSSVVDDLDTNITHILRGEDHVANTAVQIQLMEALGGDLEKIHFGHFTWIVDAEGQGLSKRIGSLGVNTLKEEGVHPLALNSFLARLGTADPIEARYSMADLAAHFDIHTFSRTSPKFLVEELAGFNTKWLHHAPYSVIEHNLSIPLPEAFWACVQGNIERLEDAVQWWHVTVDPLPSPAPVLVEDQSVLKAALETLPVGDLDEATALAWTKAIATAAGVKGPALWMPLRRALTHVDHGPHLVTLMTFMGRERCLARLKAALQAA